MHWDAPLYEQFAAARGQAFDDLLAAVPDIPVRAAIDAGCGTGRTTHRIAARFAEAEVLGIDASAAMLAAAEPADRVTFCEADVATFRPDAPVDLVVANASLHWIPQPEAVLRHLVSWLAPGGVLAVQVPANHDAPSHRLARDVAAAMGLDVAWGDHVLPVDAMRGVLEAAGCQARVWDHVYEHDLHGHAVLRWLEGTTLRPVRAAAGARYADYAARLAPLLDAAYSDGVRFPFRRRFAVAVRVAGQPSPGTGPVYSNA